jgi:hypothetical protein
MVMGMVVQVSLPAGRGRFLFRLPFAISVSI